MTQRNYAHVLALIVTMTLVLLAVPAPQAQTLYLDTNADGLNATLEYQSGRSAPWDALSPEVTSVDVYLLTDKNPDETTATCITSAQPLTIHSYEVILRTSGNGAIGFGGWTDNMGYTTPILDGGTVFLLAQGTDVAVGAAGGSKPSGAYRLGTLGVSVTGAPKLDFVTSSTVDPYAFTGFGSDCIGSYESSSPLLLGLDIPVSNAFGTVVIAPTPVFATTWGKIKQRYR